ncbi:MAG: DUF1998 domain-containing protein [Chthoniobacteraceae bacterium]
MKPVGQLRPSQLIFTFGVGSLTDLPSLSVIIMGLDEWRDEARLNITEERLLAAVRALLGAQVEALKLAPADWDADGLKPSEPGLGVPVAAFPRWLRCPRCGAMGTIDRGVFELREDRYRPELTCYVHAACQKAEKPRALPMRFLRACRNGHVSDVDWDDFVHSGMPCANGGGGLRFTEMGGADEPVDLMVRCTACNIPRIVADVFEGEKYPSACSGFHPHLRRYDAVSCSEPARTVVLGASNLWFSIVLSVLSLPPRNDKLARLVAEKWALLGIVTSEDTARFFLNLPQAAPFDGFDAAQVWQAIEKKRTADKAAAGASAEPADLYTPEWRILSDPATAPVTEDFQLREVPPPFGFEASFTRTVLVERMREVRALIGFNRIESRGEFTEADVAADERRVPLCRGSEKWVPAAEVRGEGIFLQFREEAVQKWLATASVETRKEEFSTGHREWRRFRKLQPPEAMFPGLRYVLLHSVAHSLLRQLAVECGYAAASIRERIYCREASAGVEPMAGILLYTAASDSEGTLGGLVALGEPDAFGRLLAGALASAALCGSDPLCAEHPPTLDPKTLHGACCHACLFASETSCERGNRFLDRAVLTPTLKHADIAFFKPAAEV